jgi:drug/metabolite transporter (DMT)-like permease
MLWLFLAILGYFFLAVVAMLDKRILTKDVPSPAVYTFYSTIFLAAVLLLVPFGGLLVGIDWLWALVSGLGFGFGLWTMFIAFRHGEASHMAPFIGGVVTISSFVFGYLFLGELLSQMQLIGIGILAAATFLLSFERTARRKGFHIGFVWGVLSGVLFGASHVSAKHLYDQYDFLTAFTWSRITIAILGVLLLALPSVRKALRKPKKKKQAKKGGQILALVAFTKALGVVAVVLIQYAIAIGSVTIVNALAGTQFAILFVLVVLSSIFSPKVFEEFMTKREVGLQTLAILLVVIGSIFVAITV